MNTMNTSKYIKNSIVMGVLAVAMGASVEAIAIPCAVADMTFNSANSNQCFGPVSGNDTVADINSNFGAGWNSLLKDDVGIAGDGVGSYLGVDFALGPVAGKDGIWTLSWTDNGTNVLPLTLDLAAVLKGSSKFDGYLFSGLNFADTPASGTGTWDINFLNNGGNVPDLSHFSLYVRGGEPTKVPEPATLALFGLGLVSISFASALRRRTKK